MPDNPGIVVNKPLRIMLFTAVPRTLKGGVANVCVQLARALREQGFIVDETWGRPPGQALEKDELPIPDSLSKGCLSFIPYSFHALRFVVGLFRLLRLRRPHIVNLHFIHARMAQVLLFMRPFLKFRLVLSAHGSDIFLSEEGNGKWLRRVLPEADAIVAVTSSLKERIEKFPGVQPGRVFIVPNGIDCSFWNTDPNFMPELRGPTVVTVGQLRHVKGQDVLLESWTRVLESHPDARLSIVGDGPDRADLERRAAELHIERSVRFEGQLEPKRIRSILRRARVFVLPSRSEAMPLALLEAMACGVPSVATRVGGVPEILANGAGVMVEPEDPESLGRAVDLLLDEPGPARRFAATGIERARRYSEASMVESYRRLFSNLAESETNGRRGRSLRTARPVGQRRLN